MADDLASASQNENCLCSVIKNGILTVFRIRFFFLQIKV